MTVRNDVLTRKKKILKVIKKEDDQRRRSRKKKQKQKFIQRAGVLERSPKVMLGTR